MLRVLKANFFFVAIIFSFSHKLQALEPCRYPKSETTQGRVQAADAYLTWMENTNPDLYNDPDFSKDDYRRRIEAGHITVFLFRNTHDGEWAMSAGDGSMGAPLVDEPCPTTIWRCEPMTAIYSDGPNVDCSHIVGGFGYHEYAICRPDNVDNPEICDLAREQNAEFCRSTPTDALCQSSQEAPCPGVGQVQNCRMVGNDQAQCIMLGVRDNTTGTCGESAPTTAPCSAKPEWCDAARQQTSAQKQCRMLQGQELTQAQQNFGGEVLDINHIVECNENGRITRNSCTTNAEDCRLAGWTPPEGATGCRLLQGPELEEVQGASGVSSTTPMVSCPDGIYSCEARPDKCAGLNSQNQQNAQTNSTPNPEDDPPARNLTPQNPTGNINDRDEDEEHIVRAPDLGRFQGRYGTGPRGRHANFDGSNNQGRTDAVLLADAGMTDERLRNVENALIGAALLDDEERETAVRARRARQLTGDDGVARSVTTYESNVSGLGRRVNDLFGWFKNLAIRVTRRLSGQTEDVPDYAETATEGLDRTFHGGDPGDAPQTEE